jgi:hypothetical protein
MRRYQSSEEHNTDQQNTEAQSRDQETLNREEAHANRRRVVEQVAMQVDRETETQAKISPKTQGSGGRERQITRSKPMRYSGSNPSGKVNLWQELISDNPMLQKETLSGRRSLELQTPLKRFFKRLWPLLFLASIYLCIYVFIISVYQNAYQEFINTNGNVRYWPSQTFSDANAYASFKASTASYVGYVLLLIVQFFVVVIGIPATAINKITAERERMNWDSLLMSRMTPMQVMVGKVIPVLKMLRNVLCALLPAIAITAYMGRNINTSNSGIPLRGMIMPQIYMLMASLLNITIAMYFSLKEKQSAKAALGAGRWFAIPTLGTLSATGILYTIYYLFQTSTGTQSTPIPDIVNFLFWFPNIINPIFATVYSLSVNSNDFSGGFLYWLLLPFLYPLGCALVIRNLCRKMMQQFQKSPKNASG